MAEGIVNGDKSLAQGNLAAKRYAQRMGGTANEGFRLASVGTGLTINWDTNGAVELHCEECPQLEALNPHPPELLFSVPRGGDTPCRLNCKCKLTRSDGYEGFSQVSF